MIECEQEIILTKLGVQLTKQSLSFIPGIVPKGLYFFRDKSPFLRHIKVLHDLNCPRVEDLQTVNSRSSVGRFTILYLGDTVHPYAVRGGELSR